MISNAPGTPLVYYSYICRGSQFVVKTGLFSDIGCGFFDAFLHSLKTSVIEPGNEVDQKINKKQ